MRWHNIWSRDGRMTALVALFVAVLAVSLAAAEARAACGVRSYCCMVRMQDGTYLATDVYRPRFPRGRYPAVLVRTTDGKHKFGTREARLVCRQGYALVVQDMRGCFCSRDSDAIVFRNDASDGQDTIRWIARQCWSDGNVGTWGPSAMGVAQNLLAPGAPDALKAQYVMMAFSNMYTQAAYEGGVLRQSLVEGWLRPEKYGRNDLQAVLAHPMYDQFWAEVNPEPQADRVDTPGVFCGGWYDAFLQGAINSFTNINNHGGPRARGKCRLILGPWSHKDIKRLVNPANARSLPRAADPFRFFDYWLKHQPSCVPCDKPVHYYVMGDRCDPCSPGNRWRAADNWPPPATATEFYLHADGKMQLNAPPAGDEKLSYKYDPANPVPTLGGRNVELRPGPMDQRSVESRGDVLLFTTGVLKRPIEVTGRLLATLYVSSDCPDTDFTVKLTDVYPDGRSVLLADGIRRARFRESFEREDFLEPGKVYPLTVDLWSTSIVLSKGHRIRVAVSSSNAPRFQPNPNTGRPPGDGAKPRIATNTLHLSEKYPSRITLPVCVPTQ